MTTWYYAREGQQHGPHTEEELRRFLAEGRLTPSELIWKAGMPGWVPAHTVFPPAVPAGGPPPPPPAGWSPQPPHQLPAPYAAPQPPYANPQYAPYGPPQRKERVAYILLGIFLGGLGIHNFYAGYTGRAVAQLLISVLGAVLILPIIAVWIWVIVEVITVEADARGVPFS
jgi:TM2 domain-containing membrane protein YozV